MANVLNNDKQIAIVAALTESSSIRSVERITGVHRDTIMGLGVKVGQACTAMMDSTMRDLNCQRIEMDEIWCFVGKKDRSVQKGDKSEAKRRRKDTANRVFNDLRALLTRAYDNQHVSSKAPWDTVSKFENVNMPKNEYLTVDEASRFITCCPSDFRNLVNAALLTGCRYGELCSVRVNAFDGRDNTVTVMQSKTGKVKRIFLTDAEAAFFHTLTTGKRSDDLLLYRADGEAWSKSNQQQRMKQALKVAKIERHVRMHDLRHTFASLLIQNGASIQVIANQLGHSGIAMATKHYAHLSPEYIGNTVRASKPSFALAS